MTAPRIAGLAALLALAPVHAAGPAVAQEAMVWRYHAEDNVARAVLSDCTRCDFIEMSVFCEKGSGQAEISLALHVEEGEPGQTRMLTFLFGDGAVEIPAELFANEMDATIEPLSRVALNSDVVKMLQTYVAEPQIAVPEAERQRIAADTSVEVMVENGPAKTVSLKGARDAIGKLRAFCR